MAGGTKGPKALTSGRHISACVTVLGCVRYYIRLRVLLYKVACTSIQVTCATISGCVCYYTSLHALLHILCCMHYYIRLCALLYQVACQYDMCATLVLALVYCTFLKEVRLDGWSPSDRLILLTNTDIYQYRYRYRYIGVGISQKNHKILYRYR